MIFFCCLSCVFFCAQSGYIQVQDGVIIVGSRRPLLNGVGIGNNGNGGGSSKRLLSRDDILSLPEAVYHHNDEKGCIFILPQQQGSAKENNTEKEDIENPDQNMSDSVKKSSNVNIDCFFESKSCPVCLDEYVVGDTVQILPCKHFFHKTCIIPWLTERQSTCPLCKSDVIVPGSNRVGEIEEEEIQERSLQYSSNSSQLESEISSSFSSSLLSMNSSTTIDQDLEEQGEETNGNNRGDLVPWWTWIRNRDFDVVDVNDNERDNDYQRHGARTTTPLLSNKRSPPRSRA